MKKLIFLSFLSVLTLIASAQKAKVENAINLKESGKLDQAIDVIQTTIDPNNEKSEKSIDWPRTWEVRGDIFLAVFQSEDEKFQTLSNDPLSEALSSYKKALELDTKNKFLKNVRIKLTLLSNELMNQGVEAYNKENYNKALVSFEQILEINKLIIDNYDSVANVDSAIIYNAGMMAFKTEDLDKSIMYFQESTINGYNGATSYIWLSRAYEQKNDAEMALESLKRGFDKYPSDNEVLDNLIQMYLNSDRQYEAKQFLQLAISRDPEKSVYYLAMGNLFDKNKDNENAIKYYEKAIELEPDLFMGHFNLGVIYYNEGVQLFESAGNIDANDNASYEKAMKEVNKCWEKSLPYMERCHNLDPEDKATIESLKSLYYRLNQMDKYNAILEGSIY